MKGKHVWLVVLALIALGVIVEIFVPAGARIIDIGAAVFAAATWIIPPLRFAFGGNNLRGSLARVGFHIHVVVLAACLSVVGFILAVLTILFSHTSDWAWLSILAIVGFWLTGVLLMYIGSRLWPPPSARKET